MQAEFVAPDSERWTESLGHLHHDFYHLPGYSRFAARYQEAGEPLAFIAQEDDRRLLLPIIVRQLPPGLNGADGALVDAISPRGYPGPVITDPGDPEAGAFVDRAIEAFVRACRERNIVTAFIRLHPLLSPPLDAFERTGTLVEHGHSVSIDLRLSTEDLWRQTRENHRTGIRKAMRQGYAARIDETWDSLGTFVGIYEQSMVRLGAAPSWRLSQAYFEDLRASLDGRLHLCVVEAGGEVVAGALLTEVDGLVEYHLAGTADDHLKASPSKLIVDFARQWAKERGNRCLHLAGSVRPDDPLIHFKTGFSPLLHAVSSWRLIVDPAGYRTLTDRWGAGGDGSSDQPDDFFPSYRRPRPSA
jgi:hypothetical protein